MRIRRYIQGHRRGREANRIERDAMRDPFLAEALEGYERTKENPIPHINILRRRIRSRNQRRLDVFKYGGIAASLVFILGFGIYFGFHKGEQEKEVTVLAQAPVQTEAEAPQDRKTLNRTAKEKIQATDMVQIESQSEPVIGFEAYKKYVEEKKNHPIDDCKDSKGKVTISFFVDPSGKPYDIKVEKSLCSSVDKEAIRLIKEGPLWKPVETQIHYTIHFD